MNKIKRVIIPTNPVVVYQIGEVQNGLTVYRIEDHSQEFPDGWNNLIIGFTEDRQIIFEIINAPTIVEYEKR